MIAGFVVLAALLVKVTKRATNAAEATYIVENIRATVYRSSSDDRLQCFIHHGGKCRIQPKKKCSMLRSAQLRVITPFHVLVILFVKVTKVPPNAESKAY